MKIYKKYKLKKDLPELRAGEYLFWDLWDERYTELSYIGSRKPLLNYNIAFIKASPEWFEPVGDEEELYVKFPKDFAEKHYYFGELRHNKMCRFCFDAREILDNEEFRAEVTKVFKGLYDKKLQNLMDGKR